MQNAENLKPAPQATRLHSFEVEQHKKAIQKLIFDKEVLAATPLPARDDPDARGAEIERRIKAYTEELKPVYECKIVPERTWYLAAHTAIINAQ